MSSFREDVSKLREAAAQQGDIRQAVRDKDEIIRGDRSTQRATVLRQRGASSYTAHLQKYTSIYIHIRIVYIWLSFVFHTRSRDFIAADNPTHVGQHRQ